MQFGCSACSTHTVLEYCPTKYMTLGREYGRDGVREGGSTGGSTGGRDGVREGGSTGVREGVREGGMEYGREGHTDANHRRRMSGGAGYSGLFLCPRIGTPAQRRYLRIVATILL